MRDGQFAENFEAYMAEKRDEMWRKYHRVLPSGELIFNRFDKANYLKCGKESSIYDTSVVFGDVIIGDHVWIGPYTILDGSSAELRIGNFVSIAAGTMIYTHDSTRYYVSGGKAPFVRGPVMIGNNVSIGTMSMIACGVAIGAHTVVGAHSFVNCDVPEFSIVAGVPAKPIGKVILEEEGVQFEYFER